MTVCVLAVLLGLAPVIEAREVEVQRIVDFSSGAAAWRNIDDVVMGGRSQSRMVVGEGVARFEGEVSLANDGGFASVRSPVGDHDLSGFAGLCLRLRGDGGTYGVRLRTTAGFDGVSYQAEVTPPAGEWTEMAIPFTDFVPVFRGRRLANDPPLDPSSIKSFGLIIARRQAGSFRLELAWIAACTPAPEGCRGE